MRLALLLMTALAAYAQQDQNRVLYLTHTENTAAFQEVVTLVRGLAEAPQVSADEAQKSIALHGTASQVALASWLVTQLDRPQPGSASATYEYRMTDGTGDLVRLFFTAHAARPRDFQEIATIIRSTADIRRVFVCTAPKVLAIRATPVKIAMSEWLMRELDRPAGLQQAASPPEFRVPGATDDVMRVFLLKHARNPVDVQELITMIRTTVDVQRIFAYNAPMTIAMRGSGVQAAMAAWLVDELDKPAGPPDAARHEFRLPSEKQDVLRVFYLAGSPTPKEAVAMATKIRNTADIQRLFIYNARQAVAARAEADHIAVAERLIDEWNAAAR